MHDDLIKHHPNLGTSHIHHALYNYWFHVHTLDHYENNIFVAPTQLCLAPSHGNLCVTKYVSRDTILVSSPNYHVS